MALYGYQVSDRYLSMSRNEKFIHPHLKRIEEPDRITTRAREIEEVFFCFLNFSMLQRSLKHRGIVVAGTAHARSYFTYFAKTGDSNESRT